MQQISSYAACTIVNSEPLVDFATPTLSMIIHVGGLGAREPKKVDEVFHFHFICSIKNHQKLDEILNIRDKTVIISFGTIVTASTLKEEVKSSIIEVLKICVPNWTEIIQTVTRFPNVTFIWKYERPDDEFAKVFIDRLKMGEKGSHSESGGASTQSPPNEVDSSERFTR